MEDEPNDIIGQYFLAILKSGYLVIGKATEWDDTKLTCRVVLELDGDGNVPENRPLFLTFPLQAIKTFHLLNITGW